MNIFDTPQWKVLQPFFKERDFLDGEEEGLVIRCRRNRFKAWCGYVGVPEGHSLFGKGYSERVPVPSRGSLKIKDQSPIALMIEAMHEDDGCVSLDVFLDAPGGITYSGKNWPAADGLWYFGFDCSHYNDLSPQDIIMSFGDYPFDIELDGERTYKDLVFVETATRKLAQQIAGVFK